MTFFENQAQARRSTFVLVLLFAAAVVAIVAVVNLVAGIAWGAFMLETVPRGASPASAGGLAHLIGLVPAKVYLWTTVVTLAAILFQTAREVIALSDGGEAVAAMCGGERIGKDGEAIIGFVFDHKSAI